MPLDSLRLNRLMAKRRGRILLRLIDDYMSITIVNSAWFFTIIEYEVGDSGPCRARADVCARYCGGALPPSSKSKFKVEILQPDPSDLIGRSTETKLDC